ncbi:MAG: hypothetical protein M3O46_15430, partial [Myxococcota bacterium]|nr:hypothetical protein [Myxococcota bacterium]
MTHALRSAGYTVVDVLPSMLVARVAVQHPRVVLVDADVEGVLDVVERMRELPQADDIHVIFIARPGGAIASPEEAVAHEGSGLFVRPIDVPGLVLKVQALTAGSGDRNVAGTTSSPPDKSLLQKIPSSPPSLPPASMRASIPPIGAETKSSAPPSPRTSKAPSGSPSSPTGSGRRVAGLAPPVSSELQELLSEAEQRVHMHVENESIVPSPEDEIEAVLPADLLAALDEPLDEDEDDDDPIVPRSTMSPGGGRDRTSIRSGSRAKTTTSGGSSTTSSAPRTGPEHRVGETSATPQPAHTHGGTHTGPTGEGISTTGGSDALERSDAVAGAAKAPMRPPASAGRALLIGPHLRDSPPPPRSDEAFMPAVLGPGDAIRLVARAIATRTTATLCV